MISVPPFDRAIILFVQSLRFPALSFVMRFFSNIGEAGLVWLVMIAALLLFKKTRRVGFDILVSLAICWCLSNLVVKPIVGRVRPYVGIEELTAIVKLPSDASFPSGHACASFACAYPAGRGLGRKAGIAVWVLAALITVSRVYVGVHYLTDILAGAAIGGFGGAIVYHFDHKLIPEGFLRK